MNHVTLETLISSGVHFGHPTRKWNPNYKPFIAMKKNGIHIIDLEQTLKQLEKASKHLTKLVQNNGTVLFVGTKKQAKDAVQEAADRCGMFYVVERWLGGTLTNFVTIKKSVKRLLILEKESSDIYLNKTKKELGLLERERIKLGDLHRGIKDMKYLPSAIFFVDGMHEATAIQEATKLGIPTFGMVDSNTDPTVVDFPIPANDDSLKSISFIVNYFADRIIEAKGGVVEEKITAKTIVDQVESNQEVDVTEAAEIKDESEKVVTEEVVEAAVEAVVEEVAAADPESKSESDAVEVADDEPVAEPAEPESNDSVEAQEEVVEEVAVEENPENISETVEDKEEKEEK
ncbi:MAG: 30S ribosomal protein S2 [Candidatus Marinimicrobia bacterium]|jgi:small subunit ribosomal protein S2|nr:30S ribosomal protein S2 [Candidatus Neomarinimicrobiota bacterium]MBT3682499.1 30S ribosomal protein S2 [Candidatus Neomarinimicrobiota bacterium]MBT3759263.1 30S ribosomal protein S2 [Candidatus Neomarinimicrobiota bacterium]MBT3895464.1 30S ribosomal protein S2 [Candidatus Neomarinimicrobiota bacterium]MBT4172311.1 30S ribosomal protein S2 [Candidatus Neomarinimicrobiota bacterium]